MKTTLPPDLEAKLADFRKRVWIIKLTEGVLAALFGLALSYLAVFILDRFCETPAWLRFCLLLAGAATLGLGLPLKWHRWVWRQRRLEDVARLLRHTFPRLGDQLLGIVELVRLDEGASGRSERLVQAAIAQTAEAVKDRDFRKAVPNARHWQWGIAAASVVAVVALAFAAVNPAARNALIRWIAPWSNTERFTFASIQPLPDHIVVPYDESFPLAVKLAAGTQWSPSAGYGHIGDEPDVKADLASGAYPFIFPPQRQDGTLALSLGDVRKSVKVEPKTRPELANIKVHLKLPDYLGYKTEPTQDVRDASVEILKGSQAAFDIKAIRDISDANRDNQALTVQNGEITTPASTINSDTNLTFDWHDHDGLTPRDPLVLKIKAGEDQPPTIVARRDTLEEVVLDSEVVTFNLTATDDYGVKEVGLAWTGEQMQADGKTPVGGEKIVAAGEPEKKQLDAIGTFCATREGIAPQTVEVRAWVIDYLPGRPHVRSAAFILHVLNKTDHALWLTAQFGKWLEAAKETYEREEQLNATNKELRALSPADLDRPENRRRVAQQAAAENANASRLDSLNSAGRNLVQQAMKNDEFDAKRLETWATMLKTLQDIANNRMPSVSDLLRQTASAPTGAPNPAQTTPQSPQHSSQPTPNQTTNPSKSVASLNHGDQTPSGSKPPTPIDPNAKTKPPGPSITDNEPGFNKPSPPQPPNPNATPKPPGRSHLDLPTTQLGAAPGQNNKPDNQQPPPSPAQQTMGNAVQQQNDLLAEFAKVSDQLSQIMASLEASTFVKRFKAASRAQLKIAGNIDKQTLDAFGIQDTPVRQASYIADDARKQSDVVRVIESDLDAYYERKQDARFKTTLDEMRKTDIVHAMAGDGDKVMVNLTGQGMTGSEYWADTLDRWAEEMVAASNCKASSSCSADSLPPEIVLKVMQALRDEMKLRDETREEENAKPALAPEKYSADASQLGDSQADISTHTASAITDILALPDGENKFGKDLKLLQQVTQVMNETQGILHTPETGAPAVGAETEAIELLLQSKRQGNKGGGGGGSNPGGGSGPAHATEAALADLGPGDDAQTVVAPRPVGQATGVAGQQFPDEFKSGLDSYFGLLEKQSAGK
ncbi:MAG TPA: hypothetical protein VHY09_09800 [Candidatus Methylacidiphilales bacterium]|jgi:hypothetical protein|nr:hypothetical protein [Candidatus Methylacidiphilales bacterium]